MSCFSNTRIAPITLFLRTWIPSNTQMTDDNGIQNTDDSGYQLIDKGNSTSDSAAQYISDNGQTQKTDS